MKFDMHCHTKEGSLDGKVEVEDYIKLLQEKGYGGMLISDHNSYDGYRQWRDALKNKSYKDFIVLKGIEYDTIDCGHMLVVMPTGVKLRILELRGLPVRVLIKLVHQYGGIVGPAHPFGVRYLSFIRTRLRKGSRKAQLVPLMHSFDFVEAFNACESLEDNNKALHLAKHFGKPGVGGSDAHKVDCIGTAYTILPDDIKDESDLIRYIKKTKEIACGGVLYNKTTKDKLGKFNEFLVQGFYFYNKVAGWSKVVKRRVMLRGMKKDKYIEIPR